MKNLSLTTLLIIITLGFSSCSVEQDPLLIDEVSGELFEKVSVNRNADGSYYVDMKLNEGVGVDVVNNQKNSKDLNFYASDVEINRSFNENIDLAGQGSFKLGLINTVDNNKSTITVFDDDIKFNRTSNDDHLADYSFTDNGDGSYDLNFTVDDNIEVDLVQNEATGAYEIHLDPDTSSTSQTDFSMTFNRDQGETLSIVFVNYHYGDGSSRNQRTATEDKPKIIIID